MRRVSTFVDLLKTILSFSIAFETKYNKMFVANRIVETMKDISTFDIWRDWPASLIIDTSKWLWWCWGTRESLYRWKSWTLRMPGENTWPSSTWMTLGCLLRPRKSSKFSLERQAIFMKSPNTSDLFQAPTFYRSTQMFLGDLWTVFVDHYTNSASEFVEFFWTCVCPIRAWQAFLYFMCFSAVWVCKGTTQPTGKKLGTLGLNFGSAGLS